MNCDLSIDIIKDLEPPVQQILDAHQGDVAAAVLAAAAWGYRQCTADMMVCEGKAEQLNSTFVEIDPIRVDDTSYVIQGVSA